MTRDENYNTILEILELFQRFLDRARNYDYLPGDLRMAINSINNHMSWIIHKNPHIDILTPHRMFFGEVYENLKKNIIYVRDQELLLKDLLEEIYNIELDDSTEKLIVSKGLNLNSLELIKSKNPQAYEALKNRIQIIKETSRIYKIKLDSKLDRSSRQLWIETKIESTHMDPKEKVNKIFAAIDVLRQIYKNIFDVDDEAQVYNKDKTHQIEQLTTHLSTLYELVSSLKKEPIFYGHVGVFEWPGFDGSGFTIRIWIQEKTFIEIFTKRKTNRYRLSILIKSSSETIHKIQNKIRPTKKRENQLYYEKTDLTLPQTLEEIKNIIQAAT